MLGGLAVPSKPKDEAKIMIKKILTNLRIAFLGKMPKPSFGISLYKHRKILTLACPQWREVLQIGRGKRV
tara:strand:- start:404 stop:613 length:210 start_codon:yes stop_codon:yes gene_type:complete